MKKHLIIIALLTGFCQMSFAQDELGLSFSFLFPEKSKFSIPISPLSVRGLGVKFGESVSLATGFTAYRMAESTVSNLEFESEEPILGPSVNFVFPLELILKFKLDKAFAIKVNGGVFFFSNVGDAINEGNLSNALATHYDYDLVQSNFEYTDKMGWGYQFGIQPIVYVTSTVGITLKGNYYLGESDFNLSGTMEAWSSTEGYVERDETYEGNLDFKAYELSIGVVYKNK